MPTTPVTPYVPQYITVHLLSLIHILCLLSQIQLGRLVLLGQCLLQMSRCSGKGGAFHPSAARRASPDTGQAADALLTVGRTGRGRMDGLHRTGPDAAAAAGAGIVPHWVERRPLKAAVGPVPGQFRGAPRPRQLLRRPTSQLRGRRQIPCVGSPHGYLGRKCVRRYKGCLLYTSRCV